MASLGFAELIGGGRAAKVGYEYGGRPSASSADRRDAPGSRDRQVALPGSIGSGLGAEQRHRGGGPFKVPRTH